MTKSQSDLGDPIQVPFERIYLDPNNPRIASFERPGYSDSKNIISGAIQQQLTDRLNKEENVDALESVIVNQGWVPIDAIVVWEIPKLKGHYVVVEGNRRTTALRAIRARLEKEKRKLDRMKTGASYSENDAAEQEALIKQIEQIISDTAMLRVSALVAKDETELREKLPRLHGVRHITTAKEWSPYARNLYILSLYQRAFEKRHGNAKKLEIDADLVQHVANLVALKETKARHAVQAASAFSHFKMQYEDRLPPNEEFKDEDQYFFEQILQNKYAQQEFDFSKTDLRLSPEMEEVLFKWAFALPRPHGSDEENPNKLRKAEDFRLWHQMASYEAKHGTPFASRFNVEDPDAAPQMAQVHADYLTQKASKAPVETLSSLIRTLHDLKADALRSQASHLEPMLDEIIRLSNDYLKMMKAAAS